MVYLSANVVHSGRWEHGQPQGQGERRDRSRGAVWRGEFVPNAAVGLEGEGAVLHGEGEERPQGERGERYVGQFDAGTRHGSRCGKGRPPGSRTAPHPPAWCLLGPMSLLRTPECSLSSVEACGGLRSSPRAAPKLRSSPHDVP